MPSVGRAVPVFEVKPFWLEALLSEERLLPLQDKDHVPAWFDPLEWRMTASGIRLMIGRSGKSPEGWLCRFLMA